MHQHQDVFRLHCHPRACKIIHANHISATIMLILMCGWIRWKCHADDSDKCSVPDIINRIIPRAKQHPSHPRNRIIFWRKPFANAINCVWMETSIKLLELSACRAEAAYGSERDHSKWNLLFDYNFRLNEEKKDFALHAQRVLKSLVGSFPIWCYRVFKMSQPLNEAW